MNISLPLNDLRQYIEKESFNGYDPYDALNSPILKAFSLSQKYIRILFIQALKRSPVNPRPLLFIKKRFNPKGIGLFLWGYAKLYKIEKKPEYLERIDFFLGLLEDLKSKGYSGSCWGYNFDWQSRAFYVPKFTPTIVSSSFIGHALIDTYRHARREKALRMAMSIKDFILNDLNRSEEGGAICFSYTPIDKTAVHNASLLAASLLIRLHKYSGDRILREVALASLEYTMKCQRDDGSWFYAENGFQRWIDSFHTGFNLQSILYFLEEGLGGKYEKAFGKGVEFYSKTFFLDDGTPKYYHNKLYPLDIHSSSQAIVLFSRIGSVYKDLVEKILKWMIENLQDRRGFFYFQKNRLHTNRIPYIRWAQAWTFHALTEYYLSQDLSQRRSERQTHPLNPA